MERNGKIISNVVSLHPHDIPPDDADAIELIVRMHGGEDVSIRELEVTDESLSSIHRRMLADPGVEISESSAWRFPVMTFRHVLGERTRWVLVVVDQGRFRVFQQKIEKL